jgi:gliding motility-associated-like protein
MIKYFLLFLLLISSLFSIGQEEYNNCADAFELCPNTTFSLNNIDANATVCANCEDDFNFCFAGENSIWMTFTSNDLGGDVDVNINNIVFENNPGQGSGLQAAIIEATLPCISSSYTLISNCEANATTGFVLNAIALPPNTTYYVIVNGSMGTNSNAEATFDVELTGAGIARNPQLSISTNKTTVCKDENVVFQATAIDCDDQLQFNWYANGVLIGVTIDSTFEYKALNDNDVITAEMVCFTQCKDSIVSNSITFTVLDFFVDAGPDIYILQGENIKLQGQTSGSNITWSPPYNINSTSLIEPIVYPNETTTYYLTVSNGICSIVDEVTVFVENLLKVPNTFSPNGDGINDEWEILGIDNFPDCGIQVYNRWGQLVFQTTGYPSDKRWNGTAEGGKKLAPGSYYYVINLRDAQFEEPLKGAVTIIE